MTKTNKKNNKINNNYVSLKTHDSVLNKDWFCRFSAIQEP